jgi:FKBP-type peptidyl-prolyl cis-trans isomerase FklB
MVKRGSYLLLSGLLFPVAAGGAQDPLTELSARYSYAMGVRLGQALQAQGVRAIDSTALAAAIDDVISGRGLRMDDEAMNNAVREQRAARAQGNLQAGRDFLRRNAARADVVVLPSGLQYRVVQPGTGERPSVQDTVRVHYHGTRIDGRVFDSSVERGQPAEFPLGGVVPGFREAISMMPVGARWQVFVPSELAYGERGAGADIGPNETLLFEIELLDIVR